MIGKYDEYETKFVFIDVEIVTENLYLATTTLALGIVALGGISDETAGKILGVNPKFYGRLRSASIEYVNKCFEGVMCI